MRPHDTDSWSSHYASEAGCRWWPNEELVRWVGGRQLGRVVDVGCGNGSNLRFLAEQATSVLGIDANDQALALARRHIHRHQLHGCTVRLGVIGRLPLERSSVDVVVDCMTSQHASWSEHPGIYKDYRRVVVPGGSVWVYHLDLFTRSDRLAPSGEYTWSGLQLFPTVSCVCLPKPTALEAAVSDAGFGQIRRSGVVREYEDGQIAHYTVVSGVAM